MKIIKLLIFILTLWFGGCTAQKYYLTTNPAMVSSYQTKKVHNGTLLTPSGYYHIQNKVILIPSELVAGQLMSNTIYLIENKKYYQLEKYLANVDMNDPYKPLANGLLNLFRKNYYEARLDFKKNKLPEIQYIIDLLIVDSEYEIALNYSNSLNYYDILAKYQNILDTYNLNNYYKEIINNRIKFIRYKM